MPTSREQLFDSDYHAPVLVHAVLEAFQDCATVLDCTVGGGGHTEALLREGKTVAAIDRDPVALAAVQARLGKYIGEGRLTLHQGDFTRVDEISGLAGTMFDGILADLGVSSRQLDDDARGFSFRRGVPLDMRMASEGDTAADWLNSAPESELADAFRLYGDEPRARRLAAGIVHRRTTRPFTIADDLVDAIRGALGPRSGPSDFARIFQAVRIVINDEMAGLDRALPLLRDRLTDGSGGPDGVSGGVLAVISYHSGEDRRVKHAFREWSTACHCPPYVLRCECDGEALGTVVTKKAIIASADEMARNARARSARLRVWRKRAA